MFYVSYLIDSLIYFPFTFLTFFVSQLSDVISGGATVFTRIGVRVTPVKGAAIFWYNLYRNGEGIIDTVHGACPVKIGSKWGKCRFKCSFSTSLSL